MLVVGVGVSQHSGHPSLSFCVFVHQRTHNWIGIRDLFVSIFTIPCQYNRVPWSSYAFWARVSVSCCFCFLL